MALPPRVFFTLLEIAARWGCTPTDIAEWAAMERLELITSVPLVQSGEEPIVGLVALHAADLMPMFRRDGSGPPEVRVHRLRPQNQDQWVLITTPARGLMVARADLLISATEMTRFEEENELVRRPSSQPSAYKYDWDAMYVAVIKRIHEHGLPETQAEFVGEFQDWFARRSENGDAPDERTIRRRLNPIWRELREAS